MYKRQDDGLFGGDRLGHVQGRGSEGIVADEEVPLRIGRDGDLAPGPDGLDPRSWPGRGGPTHAGAVAVEGDVEIDGAPGPIEVADRVAPPPGPVAVGVERDHEVLAGQGLERGQILAGQPQPPAGGSEVVGPLDGQAEGEDTETLGERLVLGPSEVIGTRGRAGVGTGGHLSIVPPARAAGCGRDPGRRSLQRRRPVRRPGEEVPDLAQELDLF